MVSKKTKRARPKAKKRTRKRKQVAKSRTRPKKKNKRSPKKIKRKSRVPSPPPPGPNNLYCAIVDLDTHDFTIEGPMPALATSGAQNYGHSAWMSAAQEAKAKGKNVMCSPAFGSRQEACSGPWNQAEAKILSREAQSSVLRSSHAEAFAKIESIDF